VFFLLSGTNPEPNISPDSREQVIFKEHTEEEERIEALTLPSVTSQLVAK
jgi:hypothetical protein